MREECLQRPATTEPPSHSQIIPLPTAINQEPQYPYDAWVLAGGRLFRAHSQILGAHSPYLRASINALAEPKLLLPHIPANGFGAILSYMYTGRLTLTQAPMYEILLAAHLLQMPTIIALCQTILAPSSVPSSSHSMGFLASSSEDPQEKISPGVSYAERPLPKALSAWQSLARLVPTPTNKINETIFATSTLIRPTPTRPITILQQMQTDQIHIRSESPPDTSKPDDTNPLSTCSVVLDIAACDGPVFFERVVNKAFKSGAENEHDTSSNSDSSESEINVVDTVDNDAAPSFETQIAISSFRSRSQLNFTNSGGGGSRIYHCVYCNNNFKSHYCYQKHMRRHINPITVERTENVSRETETEDTQHGIEHDDGTDVESSKRKKPTSGKPEAQTGASIPPIHSNIAEHLSNNENDSGTESHSSNSSGATNTKLKILDLNVQYFPCKTCGSKFPSYYFVHKHRRMCHREEELLERGKSTPSTPNSSLSCDSITNPKSSTSKVSNAKDTKEEN